MNVTKDVEAFKRSYRKHGVITKAAQDAGYSTNTAKMGLHALPKQIVKYVESRRRKLDKMAVLGRSINAAQQEDLARGALFNNIATGQDKSVQSIRLAMQDKRTNMLTADVQVGIINVAPPQALVDAILNHAKTLSAHSLGTTPKEQPTNLIDNTSHDTE